MSAVADQTLDIVHRYLAALAGRGIRLDRAVLFGSHAGGRPTEWSDIDVALVSPDFVGNRFDDRGILAEVTLSVDDRLDPLPFRPEQFDAEDPFVQEILRSGVEVD